MRRRLPGWVVMVVAMGSSLNGSLGGLLGCAELEDEDDTAAPSDQTPIGADEPSGASEPNELDEPGEVSCEGTAVSDEQANLEQEVLTLVNQHRASGATCGSRDMPAVDALRFHPALVCASRAHSEDMASRGYFDHESPEGTSPFTRMQEAGYDFRSAGENIALGSDTATGAMEQWMGSEPHCQNIMGSSFRDFGVGVAQDAEGKTYWTQNFGAPR